MRFNYLVGPATKTESEELWYELRKQGRCLTFNASGDVDLAIGPGDTWGDICTRLPASWRPDFVALNLAYRTVPEGVWSAPVPLIGLAIDWNLRWHWYRHALARCDLVLTDTGGVEALAREGMCHARCANLYGPGRSYRDLGDGNEKRDIDILFVGNVHPAVQRERLPWLARLAGLAGRRNVVIRTGIFGDDYRALLRRAKIVFNRSIRGECNQRVFEAICAGALMFQEVGNREVPEYFEPGKEYVAYSDSDLETLLEHYLDHEDERRAIAGAARARARQYSFADLWQRALAQIEAGWEQARARAATRAVAPTDTWLVARVWQAMGATDGGDASLPAELEAALAARPDAGALHNALGLALALVGRLGPVTSPLAEQAARSFQRAVAADPADLVAALNLVEALVALEQSDLAVRGARRILALLERSAGALTAGRDSGHFPPVFDPFRVEWERAAWSHAGNAEREDRAKGDLLRWRLHSLLGSLTGDLAHHYEAAMARPDLAPTQAAVGRALLRAGRAADAIAHLRLASAADPFDVRIARDWHGALVHCGDTAAAENLAADWRRLLAAAPRVVPSEPWFAPAGPSRPPSAQPARVIWEGYFWQNHSLALVNRELCRALLARGHDLALLPRDRGAPAGGGDPRFRTLASRCGQQSTGQVEVHVRHSWPPDLGPPTAGRWVVIQPWEYGSLPRAWLGPLCEQVDEVWVPSHFVRDCYLASGVPPDRVYVVPNGVDTECFRPNLQPLQLKTTKRWKFLFVGGTIHRKGVDVLLQAYAREFTRADDVCLVVKDMGVGTFYRGQTAEGAIARLRDDPAAPEVEYLDRDLADTEMPGLYAACDCLVHPYRGEGFGLPIAEAMACGLPVIVTGYGAALDFCDQNNAYLIPARERRFAHKRVGDLETVDYPWLAEPDAEALRVLLRRVVEQPDEAKARGDSGHSRILSQFTWGRAAAAVEVRLSKLRSAPLRRAVRPVAVVAPPPPRPRVSLCLIVKNEEQNLPDCLSSAADLVDEVIVVDTGSKDKTRDVAFRFGAKVFDFPWVDSFAAARNESLRRAAGDWILWLDADDRLDEDNRDKLRTLLAGLRDDNAAYVMKCLCVPAPGVGGSATVVDHVRLFRNRPDVRWQYRVHEQILPAIRRCGGAVRWSEVVIRHVGYQDPALRRRKLERDLRLLSLENAERPDDPFTLFNFGQVAQELGRYAEAVPLLRRSLERSHPKDSIVRKTYALLAGCHRHLGQNEAAQAACRDGLGHYPDDAELLFVDGLLRREAGDLGGAEASLRRLLDLPGADHFASVDAGVRGYKARQNLGVVYRDQGRSAEAEAEWRKVVAERPDFLPAWQALGELLLAERRWDELEAVAVAITEAGAAPDAAALRGLGHLARREFKEARTLLEAAIDKTPEAVLPRVILSRVLLQEGRDLAAAEDTLVSILRLAPNHTEARKNLAVLRRDRERTRVVADAVFSGNVGLADAYFAACRSTDPLREHLPVLVVLARACTHITDVGTGVGLAAAAFLYAEPQRLVCLDRVKYLEVDRLRLVAGRTDFAFRQSDVLWEELEETDLLFLDTWHIYDQLAEELRLHESKVRKYLVIHGTTTFAEQGEDVGHRGLWPAIGEFLARGAFRLKERRMEGNGLTVLERVSTPAVSLEAS